MTSWTPPFHDRWGLRESKIIETSDRISTKTTAKKQEDSGIQNGGWEPKPLEKHESPKKSSPNGSALYQAKWETSPAKLGIPTSWFHQYWEALATVLLTVCELYQDLRGKVWINGKLWYLECHPNNWWATSVVIQPWSKVLLTIPVTIHPCEQLKQTQEATFHRLQTFPPILPCG